MEYYARKAKVAASCHQLRQTMATQMLNADAQMVCIQRTLTETYGWGWGSFQCRLTSRFLRQEPETKKYRLGFKAFEIGMMQPDAIQLSRCAIGPATGLANSKNLVTRVGLWDGEAVMLIATYYRAQRPEISSSFGPRIQAYASSLGESILAYRSKEEVAKYLRKVPLKPFTSTTITDQKAFLKELKITRERGYAVDREEAAYGTVCVGAPLFGKNGEAIDALSISSHLEKILESSQIENLARSLLATSGEISRALQYS